MKEFTVLACYAQRKYCSRGCYSQSNIGKPHPKPRIKMSEHDRKQSQRDRQAKYCKKKHAEYDALPKIACACGCGTMIAPIGKLHQPVKYALGHNPTQRPLGIEPWNKGKPHPGGGWNKGLKHPQEQIEKIVATRRERYGDSYFGVPMSGPDCPNWKGGISFEPYGIEFNNKLKRAIRKRDGYVCQRCGITGEEYGKTLSVHHIDHDKQNNHPSNLVTVCNPCNTWYSNHRDEPFEWH